MLLHQRDNDNSGHGLGPVLLKHRRRSTKNGCNEWCHFWRITSPFLTMLRSEWEMANGFHRCMLVQSWRIDNGGGRRAHYSIDGAHRICLGHLAYILRISRRQVVKYSRLQPPPNPYAASLEVLADAAIFMLEKQEPLLLLLHHEANRPL